MAMNATGRTQTQRWRHRAFSMTELLVVIGIIAVLAGLLLVAMNSVRIRALATQTQSTMTTFSQACTSFQLEHSRYPGIVPESVLVGDTADPIPPISGTENAMLDLMGLAVRGDDPGYDDLDDDWEEFVIPGANDLGKIKVNIDRIGEGPRINGTPYSPYFTPRGKGDFGIATGQVGEPGFGGVPVQIPEILDAWGQPIMYARAMRSTGVIAGDAGASPQYGLSPLLPYVLSTNLGELGKDQLNQDRGSLLAIVPAKRSELFSQAIRSPAFGLADDPLGAEATARGRFVLLSAGPDGIYFSRADGPGTVQQPIDGNNGMPLAEFLKLGPQIFDEFDDIRVFGGG